MKTSVRIIIFLCITYFIVGLLLTWTNYIPDDVFNKYAGWVGGLASVCGLISLTFPRLSSSDFQDAEVDSLRRLAKASEDVQKRQAELDTKNAEIAKLSLQKAEMEVLVLQASQKLFLESQSKIIQELILTELEKNTKLSNALLELRQLNEKLSSIRVEISMSPNVNLLNEVLAASALQREPAFVADLNPISKMLYYAVREYIKIISKLIRSLTSR